MEKKEKENKQKKKTKKKKKKNGQEKALCTQCLHIDELSTAEE